MDDTTVKLLQKGKGKGKNKTKTARLWVYARDETAWTGGAPPAAWYQFSTARGAEHPSKHLETYAGFAHTDAYAGYNGAYRTGRVKEIKYALARLPKPRPYLDPGFLEPDNNTAKRAVHPVAVGRKNYLFMGSEAGGKSATIAYTLIETAKMNKVNPEAWLA
ncbi:transposase [Paracoccaceae bacterium]|nr:transposase [Paracoccaceae bacterium]